MNYKKMKPKAKYIERIPEPIEEKRLRILILAELVSLPKTLIDLWFNDCFEYLKKDEDYERMAQLKKAQDRYLSQLKIN